jgi:hypothetical protein
MDRGLHAPMSPTNRRQVGGAPVIWRSVHAVMSLSTLTGER